LLRTTRIAVALALAALPRMDVHLQPVATDAVPAPSSATNAPAAAAAAGGADLDVQKLFANTCGWCHSNAGRTAGRGPQLMGTALSDAEIIGRIRNGKTGKMPAFGTAFTDDELQAIVRYIRNLKDDAPAS
jgi:mono/diheme cytochrome c family protein